MRSLADRVHCGTMTLCSHIDNRDDLLSGIVGVVIETLDLSYIPGESWQACARRTAASYRALAHEHPSAFEPVAFADNDVDPVATYFEELLWLFQKAGRTEGAARTFLGVADGSDSGFLLCEYRSLVQRRHDAGAHNQQRHEASHLADLHARAATDAGIEATFRESAAG
jgi:hypothetical protein